MCSYAIVNQDWYWKPVWPISLILAPDILSFYMKILYLHGLDGSLSDEKRLAMSKYGEVFGPQIDYRATEDVFNSLIGTYAKENVDVVIGNSLGGLAAYYISLVFHTPCLIYNPALTYSSSIPRIPRAEFGRDKYLQVVLGKQDDVIKAGDNLLFLENNLDKHVNYTVHILNAVGHHIPIREFERELNFFFLSIGV